MHPSPRESITPYSPHILFILFMALVTLRLHGLAQSPHFHARHRSATSYRPVVIQSRHPEPLSLQRNSRAAHLSGRRATRASVGIGRTAMVGLHSYTMISLGSSRDTALGGHGREPADDPDQCS